MKRIIVLVAIVTASSFAHAKKSCTDQPKDKWMSTEEFKKKLEAEGYKIRKFKEPVSTIQHLER